MFGELNEHDKKSIVTFVKDNDNEIELMSGKSKNNS